MAIKLNTAKQWRDLAELCEVVAQCREKGLVLYGADAGHVVCVMEACRDDIGYPVRDCSVVEEGVYWAVKKYQSNPEIIQVIHLEDHGMIPWAFSTNGEQSEIGRWKIVSDKLDFPRKEKECKDD